MNLRNDNNFFKAVSMLPPFEKLLLSVPNNIAEEATEIRIRAGKQIAVETVSGRYICGTRCVTIEEIYNCIKHFCDYSIHSCQRELSEGWITFKGGHRAGFTGTAYIKDKKIETIKDISSINIRISREHKGISDYIYSLTANNECFKGIIIAGPPLSGKTTFLRDYCRNLGTAHKTSLIDERGEIAASYMGVPQNDVGFNTDVLNNFSKNEGIQQALRVLSPEFIVCDEVGEDTEALMKCAGNGVKTIVTVHCGNINEAAYNNIIQKLFETGTVNYIAFLGNGKALGNIKGLWYLEDGKSIDSCNNSNNIICDRYNCISWI